MAAKQETPVSEAILRVFRDLGLEDEKIRNKFQKLSYADDWRMWNEDCHESQDTRGNTLVDVTEKNA